MRAKFIVQSVKLYKGQEEIRATPVTDGSEENRSFWQYTPAGELTITVTNPDLLGAYKPGDEFYLDFTPCFP